MEQWLSFQSDNDRKMIAIVTLTMASAALPDSSREAASRPAHGYTLPGRRRVEHGGSPSALVPPAARDFS
jgi:hypothetical protein